MANFYIKESSPTISLLKNWDPLSNRRRRLDLQDWLWTTGLHGPMEDFTSTREKVLAHLRKKRNELCCVGS